MSPVATRAAAFWGGACPTPKHTVSYTGNYTTSADANFGKPAMWIRKYHEDWVELQLAHSEKDDVRGAYNAAEYLAPRRRMMQDWADFLDGRKVVDIRKGRKRAA